MSEVKLKLFQLLRLKKLMFTAGVFSAVLTFFNICAAQSSEPTPPPFVNEMGNVRRSSPQITEDEDSEKPGFFERKPSTIESPFEIAKIAAQKIKITSQEKSVYREIVKNNDLRFLKIFVAPSCGNSRLVIDVKDEGCAAAYDLLRVSYYSFLKRMHGEFLTDFRILEDRLIAGNTFNIHGFLVDLGKTEIAALHKTSDEVKLLSEYPIAETSDDLEKQKKSLEEGIEYQNLRISSNQKINAGHVYLLRIVPYKIGKDKYPPFYEDSVYVLKIVEVNEQNVALILWKKVNGKGTIRVKK